MSHCLKENEVMLDDATLIGLINGRESDRVEFTESTDNLDKIRQAVCAFANDLPNHKQPGVIFIGIRDDGSCAGINIDDALLKKLGGLRADGKIQPFPVMVVDKRQLGDCEVAVIQVEPSENPPVKVDGRCWIRVGPRRAQATSEEEKRLTEKRRWGNLPFDMSGVPTASIEHDLDMEKFHDEYLPSAVSPEVLEENQRDTKEQLKALRLVTPDLTPTVTAILMLGKTPRRFFPGAYIQFLRHDGVEDSYSIKDAQEISGTLPEQLHELDRILKANISTLVNLSGETHSLKQNYPYLALRELVRNAVIHRNYDSSNTPTRVYWFPDRVTISAPGGLYGEVTPRNFAKGATSYRNPTIAEALKNMGFMERFGIGIPTVERELKANGNPPAEFDFPDNFVNVAVKAR